MIPHYPEQIIQLPQPGALTGSFSCESTATEGLQGMLLFPSMLFPLLLILFAGMCLLNQYRRRQVFPSRPSGND